MSSFIDKVQNYHVVQKAMGLEDGNMPARMAKALIAIDDLCKEWTEGYTEECCAEQIRKVIEEATNDK